MANVDAIDMALSTIHCIVSLVEDDDEAEDGKSATTAVAAADEWRPTRTKRCLMGTIDKPDVDTCCSIASDDAHAGACSPNAVTRSAVAACLMTAVEAVAAAVAIGAANPSGRLMTTPRRRIKLAVEVTSASEAADCKPDSRFVEGSTSETVVGSEAVGSAACASASPACEFFNSPSNDECTGACADDSNAVPSCSSDDREAAGGGGGGGGTPFW